MFSVTCQHRPFLSGFLLGVKQATLYSISRVSGGVDISSYTIFFRVLKNLLALSEFFGVLKNVHNFSEMFCSSFILYHVLSSQILLQFSKILLSSQKCPQVITKSQQLSKIASSFLKFLKFSETFYSWQLRNFFEF